MFSKNNSKAIQEQEVEINSSNNIIGKGTTLEGNITTSGNMRIEGKVIGAIISKAKLVLGNTAWVKGNIIAQNAEIEGEVQGTVSVGGLLMLKRTAILQGDITTRKLVFEEGAKFNGKCKMDDSDIATSTKEISTTWKTISDFPLKKATVTMPVLQDGKAH